MVWACLGGALVEQEGRHLEVVVVVNALDFDQILQLVALFFKLIIFFKPPSLFLRNIKLLFIDPCNDLVIFFYEFINEFISLFLLLDLRVTLVNLVL